MAENSRLAESKRGHKSLNPSVAAVFRGEPCNLGRHFKHKSALREIVRKADFLACKDPDRFIYVTNWTKLLKRFKQITIRKYLRVLEEMAILTPEIKTRNGRSRKGWVVSNHADICSTNGELCTLNTSLNARPTGRKNGQRRWEKTVSIGLSIGQSIFPDDLSIGLSIGQSIFPENPEYISVPANEQETTNLAKQGERKNALSPISPISPIMNPVSPVNPVASGDGQTHSTPFLEADPPTAVSDPASPVAANENLTIGSVVLSSVDSLCGGVFDEKYLDQYEHREQLDAAIDSVLTEHCSDKYEGAASHVKLMGHVMQVLRKTHGMDAPRGWYRVMKSLRSDPSLVRKDSLCLPDPLVAFYCQEQRGIAELYKWLSHPNAPYHYREAGVITEQEYELLCRISHADHNRYPDFFHLAVAAQTG